MQKIKYYLKPRRDKNLRGLSLVYLFLRIDGDPKPINLDYYIPEKNWDYKKRELKAGKGITRSEALEHNTLLQKHLDTAQDIIKDAKRIGEQLTHQTFKQRLLGELGETIDLVKFYKEYIRENPKNWSGGTIRVYTDSLNWLVKSCGDYIAHSEITAIRSKAEKAMANAPDPLKVNTRKKHHKHIKFILGKYRKSAPHFENPYDEDPIGKIKGHRNFLEPEELTRAIHCGLKKELPDHLQNTLEQFIFSSLTGTRFSDMEEVTRKEIVNKELHYYTVKGRGYYVKAEVPIPEIALPFIQNKNGRLFNMRSENVTNRNLKTLTKILNINKQISFHCARHTFGTLYIAYGGNVVNLKDLMGHSKIETTMEYVHMSDRMKMKRERIFDKAFENQFKLITNGRGVFQVA